MHVEQIWTDNPYRNFNYLIVCPETGEALAVDPLDHEKCLGRAQEKGWSITQVLNTHEHFDHTGGNEAVIAATGARLLAHANAKTTPRLRSQSVANVPQPIVPAIRTRLPPAQPTDG